MKYNSKNKPLVCMQTQSTCYKGTRKMTVKGVLWHSTGANNPTLKRYVQPSDNASNKTALLQKIGTNSNRNDWNHIKIDAGLNGWIGKFADGSVGTVQTMPWDYRPWGCGSGPKGSCNDGWIQFEICEDSLSDRTYFNKVYQEACELTAYLCQMFKLDPKGTVLHNGVKVPVILCHIDSYNYGLGSAHGDVMHWFKKHGKTMADVRNDVYKLMYPAPKLAAKYKLVTKINTYDTAVDARLKSKSTGQLKKGTYYIYNKYPKGYNGMYNLTTDKTGVKAGVWINPSENVVTKKYVVRKAKDDKKSQKGAFILLAKAKACCQKAGTGYHVFDNKGNIVYSYKKKLIKIVIKKKPIKTTYLIGEKFKKTGLVVTALYSDKSTKTITDYSLTGFKSTKVGKVKIKVTFKNKSATFPVKIQKKK